MDAFTEQQKVIEQVMAENACLIEALEFYSKKVRHTNMGQEVWVNNTDSGEMALKALTNTSEQAKALLKIIDTIRVGSWRTVFEHRAADMFGPSPVAKLALFLDDPEAFREMLSAYDKLSAK